MNRLYACTLLLFLWPGLVQAGNVTPLQLVQSTTEQIQSRMNSDPELGRDAEKLHQLIEETLLPKIDFVGLSRLTLGRYWKQANAEQRNQFTREFRALLVRSYSAVLTRYSKHQVEYLPSPKPQDSRRAVVRTRITDDGNSPIAVDYKLRQVNKTWKIYDVSIEGISLAINYRNTFAEEISSHGLDGLIADLASRNSAGCTATSVAASTALQC